MQQVTLKQLLEAGVHFGHQTRRWNPKMQKYIFGEKNGIYIINLELTVECLARALAFLKKTAGEGREILFVATKKQAQDVVQEAAQKCEMPYVNNRWLGGMLTNFSTVRKSVARLDWIDQMEREGNFKFITKKEVSQLLKERDKLVRYLSGVRAMKKLPGAVFLIDTKKEEIALREARKLGIPTVAVIDTNCDPDFVDYPIPGNDDAIRAIKLFCDLVSENIQEGRSEFLQLYPQRVPEKEAVPTELSKEIAAVQTPDQAAVQKTEPEAGTVPSLEKGPEPTVEELAARFELEKLEAEKLAKAKRPVRAKEAKKLK